MDSPLKGIRGGGGIVPTVHEVKNGFQEGQGVWAGAGARKVGVVVFQRSVEGGLRYLLLQRPARKGGWWTLITGSVEAGETFAQAACRETREETGIETFLTMVDLGYTHTFHARGRTYIEPYFALEVPAQSTVRLSFEHVAYRWATLEEAVGLVHWPHWAEVLRLTAQRVASDS
ncbi:MAG: NUDIX domain-containing protein [Dehalococcoidia bacterium]|nr:NUDIX domain-containing protein [Dehalococcoidia bacterium]MDW8119157.1 NUDIX domain-containing protein [Chloroflexota bacterium]